MPQRTASEAVPVAASPTNPMLPDHGSASHVLTTRFGFGRSLQHPFDLESAIEGSRRAQA